MSIRSNYSEQLDAYFSGEMKGADRLVFEGRVESDPMLKAEFENQHDIISSLKSRRALELKSRLNNIAVETTLVGSLMQSSIFKPAVYAVTGLAVSIGSYMYYNTETATEFHLQSLDAKSQYSISSGVGANITPDLNFRYVHKDIEEPKIELVIEEVEESSEVEAVVANEINFELPVVDAGYQQDEFEGAAVSLESPQRIEKVPSVSKIDRINIQTITSRKYNFHYRMEDNRLYLYGRFNESPYEIIEINTPGAKKLFFYYDGDFFQTRQNCSTGHTTF
ncbi:hypothetical protein N6H18_07785 [Reichenbachiella agarivorans]|uniref:Uncharacterized protein n=1 Tax=Reichenbachiella agarivorans TaxID=2979464 RepID=A0ABY6CTK1_9BACT|nr:hypothetical protein [Reichenbachiella agarivorans]UXP33845.1 hypothetical protein N6H18_07785 [Reichenbachiella agarivorans]